MDLSAQALWQEKTHLFSDQVAIPRRVQPRAAGAQDVLERSAGHSAGRARMWVPTCSARPAPRYA
eukprot:7309143-Prymnesium_polylepis.1